MRHAARHRQRVADLEVVATVDDDERLDEPRMPMEARARVGRVGRLEDGEGGVGLGVGVTLAPLDASLMRPSVYVTPPIDE